MPGAAAVGRPVLALPIFTPAALAKVWLPCRHWLRFSGGLLREWWVVAFAILLILAYMVFRVCECREESGMRMREEGKELNIALCAA